VDGCTRLCRSGEKQFFSYKGNELKKLLLKASISEKEFKKLWLLKKNLKKPELKKKLNFYKCKKLSVY
jgi:hypothetical protein